MALNATHIWEVQTGGSDSNGGGFDPARTPAVTDMTGSSCTGSSPVISSATYNFVAGDAGHWLYIKSGTNWTPGWYKIASVASNQATLTAGVGTAPQAFSASGVATGGLKPTGVNTVAGCATTASPTGGSGMIDYSQGTSGLATGTATSSTTTLTATTSIFTPMHVGNVVTNGSIWKSITAYTSATVVTVDASPSWTSQSITVGGALLTIQKALDLDTVFGMSVYIKSGTYSISSNLSTASLATGLGGRNRIVGYNTTREDNGSGGRPVITTSAAVNAITSTAQSASFENLDLNGASTGAIGLSCAASFHCSIVNCIARSFLTGGFSINAVEMLNCEAYSNTGYGVSATSSFVSATYSHDNAGYGFTTGGSSAARCVFVRCVSDSNTGANGHGFHANYGACYFNCSSYNNAQNGFYQTSFLIGSIWLNCIAMSNGAYGMNLAGSSGVYREALTGWNAFYNNTSGERINISQTATDITLTGSPFVDAPNGDFRLNSTASAGAACRAAGFPGLFAGGLWTGYPDLGAAQHQDSGGGGGAATLINGGLVG